MSQKEIAYKMEELKIEVEKTHSLQGALFEAIYRGNNSHEEYEWAFMVLDDLTYKVRNELAKLVDIVFENLKQEVKESA